MCISKNWRKYKRLLDKAISNKDTSSFNVLIEDLFFSDKNEYNRIILEDENLYLKRKYNICA